MDIPVRPGPAGTVLVGPRPAAPAGAGLVLLPGAQLYVDPTAPDDPPFTLVHDAGAAGPALRALYGDPVTDAVLTDAPAAAGGVPVEPGAAAGPLRRLGLVRWLERHSPDTLSSALLDVEFGAAGAALDDLLAGPERDEAEDRLRRRAGFLAGLARRLRDGGPPPPPGLAALVAEALPLAHAVLPFADPAFDDVLHEVELAAALTAYSPGGPVDWSTLAGLPGVGRREPAVAGWRGDVPDEPPTSSVDWLQVPRGLLSTDEDTVTWRIVDDGTHVEVTVTALPGATGPGSAARPGATGPGSTARPGATATPGRSDLPGAAAGPDSAALPGATALPGAAGGPGLAFRLYSADRPLPIAVGPLRPDPAGGRYTGSGVLHAPASGELTLDVHDPSGTTPPRLGADRISAGGARWAARGIAALRIGAGTADDAAEQALDEAAHLFSRAADAYARVPDRTRAARREARCRAVQTAVVARTGTPVPDLVADPPVAATDVRLPDLDGPGWLPLAAESALGADPTWLR